MNGDYVMLAPKDFQAFDTVEKRIVPETELDALGINIKPSGQISDPRYIPLHFTGRFTQDKQPVFEHDILEIEIETGFGSAMKEVGVIQWSPLAGQYAITYITASEGVVRSRIVKKLGTMFLNGDLLTQGKKPNE